MNSRRALSASTPGAPLVSAVIAAGGFFERRLVAASQREDRAAHHLRAGRAASSASSTSTSSGYCGAPKSSTRNSLVGRALGAQRDALGVPEPGRAGHPPREQRRHGLEADGHEATRSGSPPSPATTERRTATSLGSPLTPARLPFEIARALDVLDREHGRQRALNERHHADELAGVLLLGQCQIVDVHVGHVGPSGAQQLDGVRTARGHLDLQPDALFAVVSAGRRQVRAGVDGVRREVQKQRRLPRGFRRSPTVIAATTHEHGGDCEQDEQGRARIGVGHLRAQHRMRAAEIPVPDLKGVSVEPKTGRSYVAELVGTFLLVFFICMVVSLTSREALGFTDWAVIGLVHALVLSLLVASLAGVCGAHFNPAVTIALASMRKIRGGDAGIYILMQLIGATLGAWLVKLVIEDEGKPVNYGATLISKAFLSGNLNGMVLELIGTFALMLAIAGTAIIAVNKSDLTPLDHRRRARRGRDDHRPADRRRPQPGARVRPDARQRRARQRVRPVHRRLHARSDHRRSDRRVPRAVLLPARSWRRRRSRRLARTSSKFPQRASSKAPGVVRLTRAAPCPALPGAGSARRRIRRLPLGCAAASRSRATSRCRCRGRVAATASTARSRRTRRTCTRPRRSSEQLDWRSRRRAKELLVLTGERPEVIPGVARAARRVRPRGLHAYVVWACERALERGLLPHTNLGVAGPRRPRRLREVTASQGLMLESISERLMETVHAGSPTKHPRGAWRRSARPAS